MNLSLRIYIGDLSQFRFELQQRLSQRIYLSSDRGDKINQYFSVNTPQHDTRPIGSINKQKWIKRHKNQIILTEGICDSAQLNANVFM